MSTYDQQSGGMELEQTGNDALAATSMADPRMVLAMQQNLPMGILAGLVAAVVSGSVWAAITVATEYQIGWMAVGVGFLVGYAVRVGGKGVTPTFGMLGAAMALLGCALGNLLSACGFLAKEYQVSYLNVVWDTISNPGLAMELMKAMFQPMDLLFYGIAVYEGFRFSFQRME